MPDEKYGEEAMACIILKDGETMTEAEMPRVHDRATSRATRCPATSSSWSPIPMNAAGKILKYKMREAAVEELGLQNLVKK